MHRVRCWTETYSRETGRLSGGAFASVVSCNTAVQRTVCVKLRYVWPDQADPGGGVGTEPSVVVLKKGGNYGEQGDALCILVMENQVSLLPYSHIICTLVRLLRGIVRNSALLSGFSDSSRYAGRSLRCDSRMSLSPR